jgi:hypothetical protein
VVLCGGKLEHSISICIPIQMTSQIPLYGVYKLWSYIIWPYFFGMSSRAPSDDTASEKETASKRQEKLRRRGERGDSRVKSVQRRL